MNKKILKKVWFVVSYKGESVHNTEREALAAAKKLKPFTFPVICCRPINLKGLIY
jgi:hypothetical protein